MSSSLVQIPLNDGSFLVVNLSDSSISRSSKSRVGVPRTVVQRVSASAAVAGGAVVEAILDANHDNLSANTVAVTGPAFAQTLDEYVAFLPQGGTATGGSHNWVILGDSSALAVHIADTSNPHSVTATQVGLGSADNTADADKPVSTAAAAALALKADLSVVLRNSAQLDVNADDLENNGVSVTGPAIAQTLDNLIAYLPDGGTDTGGSHDWLVAGNADASAHIANVSNPHAVTKAQVGLSVVNNTSDAAKPVSTLQASAIALKADAGDLTAHEADTANPHSVTKAQVGLSNVDDTSDAGKPVSVAQLAALGLKADASALTGHEADTGNPHAVTASQVGLGNCNNTSDANKPVSTLQAAALALKADDADLTLHEGDTANPHAVTKAQVGLANVDNTADANKPVSDATQTALNAKQDSASAVKEAATLDVNHDNLGANGVSVTGPAIAYSLDGYLCYLPTAGDDSGGFHDWDVLAFNSAAVAHYANTSNPHSVTKTQVGLANVDNTADANKPVSGATQTALDAKQATVNQVSAGEITNGTETNVRLYSPANVKAMAMEHGGGIIAPAEIVSISGLDKVPILDASAGDEIKYVLYKDFPVLSVIVTLDAPLATVNSTNTVSTTGPRFGVTTDFVLVWKATGTGLDGWKQVGLSEDTIEIDL